MTATLKQLQKLIEEYQYVQILDRSQDRSLHQGAGDRVHGSMAEGTSPSECDYACN